MAQLGVSSLEWPTLRLLATLLLASLVSHKVCAVVPIVGDVTQSTAEFRVMLPWADTSGQAVINIEGHGSGVATLKPGSERFAAWRAEGLAPDTGYEYTVAACGGESASGVFRTLPVSEPSRPVKIVALAGLMGPNVCKHATEGFPLSSVQEWAPDIVLALGDMIDSDTECRDTGVYGQPQEAWGAAGAAVTTEDYLRRWKYVFRDSGFQQLLSNSSYIATWDDGEILEGAGPALDVRFIRGDNIPDGRHLLPAALAAVTVANPIAQHSNTPGRLYRSFQVGDVADVFVLDLRQYRDAPIQRENQYFPKTMLGLEQKTWLWDRLSASNATWKVLLSSVPLSVPIGEAPDSGEEWPSELGRHPDTLRDGWAAGGEVGGYANELAEIMEQLHSSGANNVLWLSAGGGRAEVLRLRPLESDPAWTVYEVMVGPMNGLVRPGKEVDGAVRAETLFRWAPQEQPKQWTVAKEWLNFAGLTVQPDGALSVEIINALGDAVYEAALPTVPNSEPKPRPETTLGGVHSYTVASNAEQELVAYAGDANADSAVIVVMAPGPADITLRYWGDGDGGEAAVEVETKAERAHGFFAKARLTDLRPNTKYRYVARMAASRGGGELDASGSFWTMPLPGDRKDLKLAFFGDLAGQNVCRDRDEGFPALAAVAEFEPEVVVGLGDIVYVDHDCHDRSKFGNRQIPHPRPPLEGCQICLPSFWDKCRYNHEDRHFKATLKDANFVGIWDDHEGVNDFTPYLDLRFNNEPSYPEGVHLLPFGLKGMLDCSPTMPAPNTPKRLYRHFAYGDTADIFVLDTRQYRDPSVQADSKVTPKTMLGLEQKRWLLETLRSSRGTWKVMVTSMPLVIPTGSEYRPDKWESEMGPEPETWRDGWTAGDQTGGYENEMREILRAMAAAGQRNVIFIATDVHCSFVYRHEPFRDDPSFRIHEIITGPVNADLFPKRGYSRDFFYQTSRLFQWHPNNRRDVDSWREAKRYFNFGTVEINRRGRLTARVRRADGDILYTLRLDAEDGSAAGSGGVAGGNGDASPVCPNLLSYVNTSADNNNDTTFATESSQAATRPHDDVPAGRDVATEHPARANHLDGDMARADRTENTTEDNPSTPGTFAASLAHHSGVGRGDQRTGGKFTTSSALLGLVSVFWANLFLHHIE